MAMMRLVVLYTVLVSVSLMCSLVLVIYLLKPDHVHNVTDCHLGYGCIPSTETSSSSSSTEIRSRKLLLHNNAEEVFKSFVPVLVDQQQQQQQGDGNVNVYWSSLRSVPSGPDPLHHNGSGPKKPRHSVDQNTPPRSLP